MKAIKKFIAIVSSIFGGCLGIILLGLINVAFGLQLSFTIVFTCGLAGGVILGNLVGFYLAYFIVKRAKRYLSNSLSGLFNRIVGFRR